MNKFNKDKRTNKWRVIGDEVQVGTVTVTKANGETQQVEISEVSPEFEGKFGEFQGKTCRFGTIREEEGRGDGDTRRNENEPPF